MDVKRWHCCNMKSIDCKHWRCDCGVVADPGGPVAESDFSHLTFFRNSVIFNPLLLYRKFSNLWGLQRRIFKDNFYNLVIFSPLLLNRNFSNRGKFGSRILNGFFSQLNHFITPFSWTEVFQIDVGRDPSPGQEFFKSMWVQTEIFQEPFSQLSH